MARLKCSRTKRATLSFVMLYKDLPKGGNISLEKYFTEHPKTMSPEMRAKYHPDFDETYEIIIKMKYDHENSGSIEFNTHPKISWYLDKKHFLDLCAVIRDTEDLQTVDKTLWEAIHTTNPVTSVLIAADGLVKKLGEK